MRPQLLQVLALLSMPVAFATLARAQSGGIASAPQALPDGAIGNLTTAPLAKFELPNGVYHGASLPDTWNEGALRARLAQYQSLAGKKLSVVTWFASTYENGRLTSWKQNYAPVLQRVKRAGALSLVKFSTQDAAYEGNKKIAKNGDIAQGVYDAYFEEMADAVKNFGEPVFISIDHEMNGNWYPFSQDYPNSGTNATEFVAMWRHIVGIFRARGANNVAWVWSPNVPDVNGVPAVKYYPGDDAVDWVGASFYSGNPLSNLRQIYARYASKKPIFITEWATAPEKSRYYQGYPGDAKWVGDFFKSIETNYPRVKAISWFNWDKSDGNYLLDRTPEQAKIYNASVQKLRYVDLIPKVAADNAQASLPPIREVPREIVLDGTPRAQTVKTQAVKTETVKTEEVPVEGAPRRRLKLTLSPTQ